MSIEDRDWYKEDFLRRQALPDPLKPSRPVKFATAPESSPNLSSGLIFLVLLSVLAVGVVASLFF